MEDVYKEQNIPEKLNSESVILGNIFSKHVIQTF